MYHGAHVLAVALSVAPIRHRLGAGDNGHHSVYQRCHGRTAGLYCSGLIRCWLMGRGSSVHAIWLGAGITGRWRTSKQVKLGT